jgi:hypothetical protein
MVDEAVAGTAADFLKIRELSPVTTTAEPVTTTLPVTVTQLTVLGK